jgi:hypothetical protein
MQFSNAWWRSYVINTSCCSNQRRCGCIISWSQRIIRIQWWPESSLPKTLPYIVKSCLQHSDEHSDRQCSHVDSNHQRICFTSTQLAQQTPLWANHFFLSNNVQRTEGFPTSINHKSKETSGNIFWTSQHSEGCKTCYNHGQTVFRSVYRHIASRCLPRSDHWFPTDDWSGW